MWQVPVEQCGMLGIYHSSIHVTILALAKPRTWACARSFSAVQLQPAAARFHAGADDLPFWLPWASLDVGAVLH
jgi:hypothetical protein